MSHLVPPGPIECWPIQRYGWIWQHASYEAFLIGYADPNVDTLQAGCSSPGVEVRPEMDYGPGEGHPLCIVTNQGRQQACCNLAGVDNRLVKQSVNPLGFPA